MSIDDYVRMVKSGWSPESRRQLLESVPYQWREKVRVRVIADFAKKARRVE